MPVSLRSRSTKIKTEPEEDLTQTSIPKRSAKSEIHVKIEKDEDDVNAEAAAAAAARNIEEIRRKNLEDNKAFLEGLLMTKIRDDFKNMTNSLQPNVKKEGKKRDFKYVTVTENVPVRRSRRLANMDVDGNRLPSPEESEGEEVQQVVVKTYRRQVNKRVPDLTPEEQEAMNEKIKNLFEQTTKVNETKSKYDFSDLQITDENVLKITPDRILFMDVHPRSDQLAIIGCDRKGTLGLVVKPTDHIHGAWSKINYDFHTEFATCCRFDRFHPQMIHSTSYDSTLRSYDVTKSISTECYKEAANHALTAFDYLSDQVMLIIEDNGDVLRIDLRTSLDTLDRFDVSKKRLRSLHLNPSKPEEFCLAGTDNCVKVYDLRNMSNMKYCLQSGYSAYSAYYNMAGTHILVTTRDDHLASFSMDEMTNANDPMNISPTKRISHRNYVNRFVTPFTGQPNDFFENYFMIGSDRHPRCITILDGNCRTVGSLSSENLNSLATVNVAHRSLPIVVAGNSSGRIHVFTGQI